MRMKDVVAVILAGGQGSRLGILSDKRAKPAVPFGGKYRIIDFTLSNCVDSGIFNVAILTQYRPRSLNDHIGIGKPWDLDRKDGGVQLLQPYLGRHDEDWYKGTADAVYRNLHLIERERPDLVAVFAADHVYRMDVRQMARFHQERGAEVSVAAVPVPIEKASAFGILATGSAGELCDFQEKPLRPAPMATDPDRAYASMGNYLFDPPVLQEVLEQANQRGDTDFGHHILPNLPHRHRVFAYDFAGNKVPGVRPQEERSYWRDIGTVDAYRAAQRDVLGPMPRFNLGNPEWPIRGDAHRVRNRMAPTAAMASAGTTHIAMGASAHAALAQ